MWLTCSFQEEHIFALNRKSLFFPRKTIHMSHLPQLVLIVIFINSRLIDKMLVECLHYSTFNNFSATSWLPSLVGG